MIARLRVMCPSPCDVNAKCIAALPVRNAMEYPCSEFTTKAISLTDAIDSLRDKLAVNQLMTAMGQ